MSTIEPRRRSALIAILPLAVFVALVALFYVRLGAGDAARLPSALIGKSIPDFELPSLTPDRPRVGSGDLRKGKVTLLNVFASWCLPCHAEHPLLMALAQDATLRETGVEIVGLAYKDDPGNSRRFLGSKGNPYAAIAVDANGRTGIDFGVYGVPETFIIRGDGTIAFKFVGPLTEDSIAGVIRPELAKARK